MKNIKYFKFLILIFLIFSNCSSFYEAKNKTKWRILVGKPLVSTRFWKITNSWSQTEQKNENIKDLIISKDKTNTQPQNNSNESQSLEKSIIEKIQNN